MNPYDVLGLPTNATPLQIKKEYRRLSAKFHPDKGGTEEEFLKIKLSYDVLGNAERRRRYDTTGRIDESPVTPERVQMFIDQTMRTVIEAQRPDGRTDDPVFENIRDKIILSLLGARAEIKNQIFRTQRKLERTQRLLERFKTQEEVDPVGKSLQAEKKRLEGDLHVHEDALELSLEVERVLKTYTYEVGPGPEGQFSPGPTLRRGGVQFIT